MDKKVMDITWSYSFSLLIVSEKERSSDIPSYSWYLYQKQLDQVNKISIKYKCVHMDDTE
jgi:hypothetical protein